MVRVLSKAVGAFMTNAFLAVDPEGREAALIDPGAEPDVLSAMIEDAGVPVKYMIATHCHLDHIGAAAEMGRRLGLDLLAGEADAFLLESLAETCALYGLPPVERPAVGGLLRPDLELPLGGCLLRFREAPGHTPGSFIVTAGDRDAFAGDVVFMDSVGRTDLPGGDASVLRRTIREVILAMDDGIALHPGHGPSTTVGRERRENPFLIEWGGPG